MLSKGEIQGRSGPVSSGVSFDWSANTLEFQAACAGSVSLTLKENASQTLYYTVLVDGKEQKRAHRTGSRLFLAENLPKATTPSRSSARRRAFMAKRLSAPLN
ncbi:MAG: hypothetical protein ACLU9S_09070 [Oscillospiraceae bacterium]